MMSMVNLIIVLSNTQIGYEKVIVLS